MVPESRNCLCSQSQHQPYITLIFYFLCTWPLEITLTIPSLKLPIYSNGYLSCFIQHSLQFHTKAFRLAVCRKYWEWKSRMMLHLLLLCSFFCLFFTASHQNWTYSTHDLSSHFRTLLIICVHQTFCFSQPNYITLLWTFKVFILVIWLCWVLVVTGF